MVNCIILVYLCAVSCYILWWTLSGRIAAAWFIVLLSRVIGTPFPHCHAASIDSGTLKDLYFFSFCYKWSFYFGRSKVHTLILCLPALLFIFSALHVIHTFHFVWQYFIVNKKILLKNFCIRIRHTLTRIIVKGIWSTTDICSLVTNQLKNSMHTIACLYFQTPLLNPRSVNIYTHKLCNNESPPLSQFSALRLSSPRAIQNSCIQVRLSLSLSPWDVQALCVTNNSAIAAAAPVI